MPVLILFSLLSYFSFGQTEQLVLKSSFDLTFDLIKSNSFLNGMPNRISKSSAINLTLSNSWGKLKNDKDLLYYGLIVTLQRASGKDANQNKSTNTKIGLGANIGKQKFFQITPMFYYCPDLSFGILYQTGRYSSYYYPGNDQVSKFYTANFSFLPFNIGFKIKKNIITTFNIGRINIGYSISKDKRENSGIDAYATNSVFSFTANSNSYNIGLIYFPHLK